jgi:meso-butanediol dehydrogenase/(S,S)-butanediol dehydrogenase/diacetyl reductase
VREVDRAGVRGLEPVAVVTGAGSGIGRATALRMAADGYRVTLAGRRESALTETAQLIDGPPVLVTVCDVTDADAVRAMITATADAFGRIDVVVNNAGISRRPRTSNPPSWSPRPRSRFS